jgi:hypothetical protein
MKTYFYRRANGELVRIEAEQMFWSGTACVFVRNGLANAVISLLPGEIVFEQSVAEQNPQAQTGTKPN